MNEQTRIEQEIEDERQAERRTRQPAEERRSQEPVQTTYTPLAEALRLAGLTTRGKRQS